MSVLCLGYIGFKVSDLGAWTDFAVGVLGLMPTGDTGEERRFRLDKQAWRVTVSAGAADDIDFIGLETAGPTELDALAERLRHAGVAIGARDPDLARARGVAGVVVCKDPQGLMVEIYYGPTERQEIPFSSPAGVAGFVTGDQGVGHVVLATPDIDASRRFYQDLLGFRLSDIITLTLGGGRALDMEFFHCNARHHTLALVPAPSPRRLHHFMLQAVSLDDVGFCLERAQRAGTPIAATLGRHTNDNMVSFYARTPSGFEVEFGWGARTVEPTTWRVARHDSTSVWGHRRGSDH